MNARFLGACLVVAGGALYGLGMARVLQARVREIGDLITALDALEHEIAGLYTPLPEAFSRAARSSRGAVRRLFVTLGKRLAGAASVPDAWRAAVDGWSPTASLGPEELDILAGLGGVIGRTGAPEQARALRYAAQRLQRVRERLERDLDKQLRLRLYLGVAGGITLAILLV